mgnify:CR=1 FL=1
MKSKKGYAVTGFEPVVCFGGELYTVYTEKASGEKLAVSTSGKMKKIGELVRDTKRFIDAQRAKLPLPYASA